MKTYAEVEANVAKAKRKYGQVMAQIEAAYARERVKEKKRQATRRYRLGLIVESFLFEDRELCARVEELVRSEDPRVRVAFRLHQSPTWFEQPERGDPKTVIDTRRSRLGIIVERLLPGDAALCARVEALVREQSPHVRDAFGMEERGPSWSERLMASNAAARQSE